MLFRKNEIIEQIKLLSFNKYSQGFYGEAVSKRHNSFELIRDDYN